MRWRGFRKVRRQVCKRVASRIGVLGLSGLAGYRAYLEETPTEWCVLDSLCRITISRFYRDRAVFEKILGPVLREIAASARVGDSTPLEVWSIGCASGEEAYTLAIASRLTASPLASPQPPTRIIATDIDETMLSRARAACYRRSSIKDLPPSWVAQAFEASENRYCLRSQYRDEIQFLKQDVRTVMPDGQFHLILCRNLVFTYFDLALQIEILHKLLSKLRTGGALVIGKHESLPQATDLLRDWFSTLGIYRKV